MDKAIQDVTLGTVGWFAFAAGTVGLAAGQTLRLSVVNLSPFDAIICWGSYMNPRPLLVAQGSYTIGPGEARDCDLKASDLPREGFDNTRRAQIRALVRSSSRTVYGNLELFDSETGKTSIILPLQEVLHRE